MKPQNLYETDHIVQEMNTSPFKHKKNFIHAFDVIKTAQNKKKSPSKAFSKGLTPIIES